MTPSFPDSLRIARGVRAGRVVAVALVLGVTATAAAPGVIRIRRGDTLSELARRHGTTVAALRELNGLGGSSVIIAGRTLRISRTPLAAKPARPAARWVEVTHVVVRGDSLIKIAKRYGQTPDGIARRNRLPRSGVVRLGQRLVVGSRKVSAAAPRTGPAAARVVEPPAVSRTRVRRLIEREARRRRVDPHLAVALAWQESGLQHDVVSSAGALGAMQVMPATGKWVSTHLAKRPLDLYDVEDNVEAGVRYLAQLLKVAPDRETALAGYYQGLRSVRTRGMYRDTVQYVRNIAAIRRRLAGGGAPRT